MGLRQQKKQKREERERVLALYHKEIQRNVLAKPGPMSFIIVLDHLKGGFNVPKIFRSAEAFGCHEIHLINVPPFDPRPAKGALRKIPTRFHESFSHCYQELTERGYQLFALDAQAETGLPDASFPEKAAFILGNEGIGLCFNQQDYPDVQLIGIPHQGQTESLNVSVAASIVMYEYSRQFARS